MNTEYNYRLVAFNNWGDSAPSSDVSVYTLVNPPGNVTVSNITQTGFKVSWTTNNNPVGVEYGIDLWEDDTHTYITSGFGVDLTEKLFSGLSPGTKYHASVYSLNSNNNSNTVTKDNIFTIPPTPPAPSLSVVSSGQINISWSSVQGATGYKIDCNGTVTDVGNVTSYSYTGLTSNTLYTFRIAAYNAYGQSFYGSSSSATTQSVSISWDYRIRPDDTPNVVDTSATTAVVDISNNEIRLPATPVVDLVSFWGSGEADYLVATISGIKHFSYNGSTMVENTLLNVSISNPLALAAPDPFPDVVVADASGIKHYSFSGSTMVQNPALSVAGLTGVAAIGAAGQNDITALTNNQVQHYTFNGASMARNTVLEPSVSFTNPIDIALGSGGYDTAVLEPNRVRWFNFTGSGMAENPALAVTGLTNPVAMAVADPSAGWDVAVVDGSQVKHYSFTGTGMAYNATLSVTTGLTSPRAVAVRPGGYDRIIVDGNQVKYYTWTGSSMVYDPNRSVTVANLIQGAGYRSSAAAVSKPFDPGANAVMVRVRAAHELPNNTSVTWSVTADGANWVKRWRVRGTASGTVLEVSPDNGVTWNPIGTANDALPSVNNTQLWAAVAPGRAVTWKAELATTDTNVTPKIATSPRGGVAVRLDTNSAPNPPLPQNYGTCFTTTTPMLSWTFSDPDPGDSQRAYQVQIVRASDYAPVLDSGKVMSGSNQYAVPTSTAPDMPGPMWSSGAYQFKYRVMVWDQAGVASSWSNWTDFCVNAFERPRIAQIVSPPAGQVSPDPATPATHIVITPGMTAAQLPHVKAGAKVVLLVDSIGPLNSFSAAFPYLSQTATVNVPAKLPDGVTNNPMFPAGSAVNRWAVEFWTNPSLAVCPSGTVVQVQLSGSGAAGSASLNAPPYADGVVVTEGSIYSDWFVVLQGRDTN
ncbi:MAG: fibronectin type III domain-containing protein [Peptococcaceae bacterium]|nr:fibronectin type III domain-containing protein [Peptococcaceae bacterium]